VAGFPAFTDNHVRQQIVEGLLRRGWRVVRSVDAFGQAVDDDILFDYAAREGLVFVTCDRKIHAIAKARSQAGQAFRMVFWKQAHHVRMSDGDFIRALEELSQRSDAFSYSIEYIKPKP
jgi:hypothetical protein